MTARKISLLANLHKSEALPTARMVIARLRKAGVEVLLRRDLAEALGERDGEADFYHDADMVLCLGGDGTLLTAVRALEGREIPILGINLGGLGFLTAVPSNEVDSCLEAVLAGDCRIEERRLIKATTREPGGEPLVLHAFNDIVVDEGSFTRRAVVLKMSIDHSYVGTFTADGLIVAYLVQRTPGEISDFDAYRDEIAAAVRNEEREIAASRWYDAFSSGGEGRSWAGARFGNRFVDSRTLEVEVGPEEAFAPIRRIGGETGWYAYDRLWRLRGFLDLLAGGVGVRRGRPAPEDLHVGDALDFWRVEAYEPDRRLRLSAEMKVPGRAWLEFEVVPRGQGATIRQTALFDPVGLLGLVYWYAASPLHRLVFSAMLRGIARAATPPGDAADGGPRRR